MLDVIICLLFMLLLYVGCYHLPTFYVAMLDVIFTYFLCCYVGCYYLHSCHYVGCSSSLTYYAIDLARGNGQQRHEQEREDVSPAGDTEPQIVGRHAA